MSAQNQFHKVPRDSTRALGIPPFSLCTDALSLADISCSWAKRPRLEQRASTMVVRWRSMSDESCYPHPTHTRKTSLHNLQVFPTLFCFDRMVFSTFIEPAIAVSKWKDVTRWIMTLHPTHTTNESTTANAFTFSITQNPTHAYIAHHYEPSTAIFSTFFRFNVVVDSTVVEPAMQLSKERCDEMNHETPPRAHTRINPQVFPTLFVSICWFSPVSSNRPCDWQEARYDKSVASFVVQVFNWGFPARFYRVALE